MTEREDLIRRAEACERLAEALEAVFPLDYQTALHSAGHTTAVLRDIAIQLRAANLRRQAGVGGTAGGGEE